MSKRCPECSAVYPDDSKFCSQDGNALVDNADGEPSRPSPGPGTTVRRAVRVKDVSVDDIAGSLESTVLDTRYKILRKLGEGGMAFVYEAQELNSGESVALKVISPKLNKDREERSRTPPRHIALRYRRRVPHRSGFHPAGAAPYRPPGVHMCRSPA